MKVGLLLCDHVNAEYQSEFGDYSDMFSALFPSIEFVCYDAVRGELPSNLDDCDAYMGTGSRYSVYDDEDWIRSCLKFLRDLHAKQKCFVGVCFSHQLIGQALGGKVEKSEQGWCVGIQSFEPLGLNLLMMCQDQVVDLPPETKVIAGTSMCRNGIIQVGKSILGIQAHPEFTKDYNKLLMEQRVGRMGEDVVRQGINSLKLPVHREEIKQYILNFMKNSI